VSDQQPSAWGGPPTPQQTQPVVNRQCQRCGWPTPAADPVCRNCGDDARVAATTPPAGGLPPGPVAPPPPGVRPLPGGPHGLRPHTPVAAPGTNGMAVASLVLGILWIYWIGSVLALIFGYIARQQIDRHQGMQGGRGMATAGIVLGWIGVGFLVLFILVAILGMASGPSYDALRLVPS
jgi:Domain of unknown function (DUF4190)